MTDSVNDSSNISTLNGPTSQISFSTTSRDDYADILSCRNRIRELEADNVALKRLLPIIDGVKDEDGLLKKIKSLATEAETAKQLAQRFEEMCADKERANAKLRKQMFDELDKKDKAYAAVVERAREIEQQFEEYKAEAEDQQSKLYHLANDEGDPRLSIANSDFIDKLQMELQDRTEEIKLLRNSNEELEQKLLALYKRLDINKRLMNDMTDTIARQQKFVNDAISGEVVESNWHEMLQKAKESMAAVKHQNAPEFDGSGDVSLRDANVVSRSGASDLDLSEDEYVISNMLMLLDMLNKNEAETKRLQAKTIQHLRELGYEFNAKLADTLTTTFRDSYANKRDYIKRHNKLYEAAIGIENSELRRNLNELENDSICSSTYSCAAAANAQERNNTFANSFADMLRNTTGIDFFNKTSEITQDLGAVTARMNALRKICVQLFNKLRGTAEFLENILETLGETEEGRELLEKINDLRFDLDKSLGEARLIADDIQRTEKTLNDFCEMMGQTMDQSEFRSQAELCDAELADKVGNLQQQVLDKDQQNHLLQDHIQALELDIDKLKEQLESHRTSLANKTEEIDVWRSQVDKLEQQMQDKNQQNSSLQEHIHGLMSNIDELKKQLESYSTSMAEKNEEIGAWRSQVDKLKQHVQERDQQNNSLQNHVQALTASIDEWKAQLESYRTLLADKSERISNMESQIGKLRRQVLDSDKENDALQKHIQSLMANIDELKSEIREKDELTEKANENLYNKIMDGMAFEDETILESPCRVDEKIESDYFGEFTKFLQQCQEGTSKVVQLLKKADEAAKKDKLPEIPYHHNMITEARNVRYKLYQITKFFDSQKENFGRKNHNIGREIYAELERIYRTLKDAKESTSHTSSHRGAHAVRK